MAHSLGAQAEGAGFILNLELTGTEAIKVAHNVYIGDFEASRYQGSE